MWLSHRPANRVNNETTFLLWWFVTQICSTLTQIGLRHVALFMLNGKRCTEFCGKWWETIKARWRKRRRGTLRNKWIKRIPDIYSTTLSIWDLRDLFHCKFKYEKRLCLRTSITVISSGCNLAQVTCAYFKLGKDSIHQCLVIIFYEYCAPLMEPSFPICFVFLRQTIDNREYSASRLDWRMSDTTRETMYIDKVLYNDPKCWNSSVLTKTLLGNTKSLNRLNRLNRSFVCLIRRLTRPLSNAE